MIRTLALLKWLVARLEQLTALLDDLRQRTVGAALNATTEKLVAERRKVDAIDEDHSLKVDAATQQLKEELKLAHARYSDTLTRLGGTLDKKLVGNAGKCKALEAKRKALRDHITTG